MSCRTGLTVAAANANQMLGGVNKHAPSRDRWRAVCRFGEWIARENFKLLRHRHYHNLAAGRDPKQPSVRTHGRAEIISTHALLPHHFTGRGPDAADDAAVAPQVNPLAHANARGHIRRRTADFVRPLALLQRVAGPAGGHVIAAPPPATRAENQIARDDRRTDAALVERAGKFPD